MRVAFEQVAVFVDAGLALLGIHQQEFLLGRGVAGRFPLRADREVGAAAAAQAGIFDDLPHAVAAQAERFRRQRVSCARRADRRGRRRGSTRCSPGRVHGSPPVAFVQVVPPSELIAGALPAVAGAADAPAARVGCPRPRDCRSHPGPAPTRRGARPSCGGRQGAPADQPPVDLGGRADAAHEQAIGFADDGVRRETLAQLVRARRADSWPRRTRARRARPAQPA